MRTWREFGRHVTQTYTKLQEMNRRPTLQDQALLGVALLAAKIALPPRCFQPWLRDCTGLSQKTARRYVLRWRKYMLAKGWDPDLLEADFRVLNETVQRRLAEEEN